MLTKEEAAKKLSDFGQEHVLRYYEELDDAGKADLLTQIEETDFSVLSSPLGACYANVVHIIPY